jgi:hypothetical protein
MTGGSASWFGWVGQSLAGEPVAEAQLAQRQGAGGCRFGALIDYLTVFFGELVGELQRLCEALSRVVLRRFLALAFCEGPNMTCCPPRRACPSDLC